MCTVQGSRHISVLWFNLAWGGVRRVPFKARATSVEPPATCINIQLDHWDLHTPCPRPCHPYCPPFFVLKVLIFSSLFWLSRKLSACFQARVTHGAHRIHQGTLWWNNVHLDTRHSINFFAIFCVHWDIFYTEVINFTLREGFRKKESF